jgi:hypothetical protein
VEILSCGLRRVEWRALKIALLRSLPSCALLFLRSLGHGLVLAEALVLVAPDLEDGAGLPLAVAHHLMPDETRAAVLLVDPGRVSLEGELDRPIIPEVAQVSQVVGMRAIAYARATMAAARDGVEWLSGYY